MKQYVQLTGRGIVSVAADDGRVLWTYNRVANGTANIPTPIVKGDLVFCSSGYGTGAALLKIVPHAGGLRAEEVYFLEAKDLQNHHGGMIVIDGALYGANGGNGGGGGGCSGDSNSGSGNGGPGAVVLYWTEGY